MKKIMVLAIFLMCIGKTYAEMIREVPADRIIYVKFRVVPNGKEAILELRADKKYRITLSGENATERAAILAHEMRNASAVIFFYSQAPVIDLINVNNFWIKLK